MIELSRRTLLKSSVASLAYGALPAIARGQTAPARASVVANTNWLGYANDLASTRYAALDQISADNFNKLQVAWTLNSNNFGPRPDVDWQSTPILANGRLYVTIGSRRDVVALNPATGEILWVYAKDEGARQGTRGGPGFGCSYWTDGTEERILFATVGYQLISLDAKTGIPDPAFGTGGIVDLRDGLEQQVDKVRAVVGIHSTPLIVKDTAVVGAAPTAALKAYLRGFDVRTGKMKWLFHTVPKPGEFGHDTWVDPKDAETTGNSGVWAQMSADPELNLVYAGCELSSGDQVGVGRKGNALFNETIVALDIDTGQRKWHYQLEHHGIWDRDIPCAAILFDMPVGNKTIKALAQPSKQGFTYILDRATGKPLFPTPEVKVPAGDVPGEWYSKTQPRPSKPPPFDKQGFTEDDLIDWTPELRARAVEIAKHYRMGSLWTPPAWTAGEGPWGTMILPGTQGGANWPGGSYDPETHIMYVYSKTAVEAPGIGYAADGKTIVQTDLASTRNIADTGGGGFGGGRVRLGVNDGMDAPISRGLFSIEGLPLHKPPYGRITALDLAKGTLVWQTAHGETPDFIKNHPRLKGVTIPRTGQASILGTLTTKTLVICGDGGLFTDEQGRKGARLRAYDKATGREVGAVFIAKPQTGAAMTYIHDGRQYIVTAISNGTGGDLVAFRLPNTA